MAGVVTAMMKKDTAALLGLISPEELRCLEDVQEVSINLTCELRDYLLRCLVNAAFLLSGQ